MVRNPLKNNLHVCFFFYCLQYFITLVRLVHAVKRFALTECMLFTLVSLDILLNTYPHTALLTILHIVKVLPMYLNFNLKFTSLLGIFSSALPLMFPLFGIHFLKTFAHNPLLPLLERSSKPISMQRHILLSSFSLMASLWCQLVSVPGFLNSEIAIVLLCLRVHYSLEIKRYKIIIK